MTSWCVRLCDLVLCVVQQLLTTSVQSSIDVILLSDDDGGGGRSCTDSIGDNVHIDSLLSTQKYFIMIID